MQFLRKYTDELMIVLLAVIIVCAVYICTVVRFGDRTLGVLETIHGIPYPVSKGAVVILEDMAHSDLFLEEPVFAKQATLTILFDPGTSESIDIGIRENEFWLSYEKYPVYRRGVDVLGAQTKNITIPLTSVIQDKDRSVDLMFFTTGKDNFFEWRVQDFHATVQLDMPTYREVKAYIKSIVRRERPL